MMKLRDPWWEIIILLGSFVVLGFVVLFALQSYRGVERSMAAQYNREQQLLARQVATGIQQHLRDIGNVLSLTAGLDDVQVGDAEAIESAVMDAFLALKNKVAFVFWEDRDGTVQFYAPEGSMPGLRGKNFSYRSYFRMARDLKVPYVSDVIMIGGEENFDIPNRFHSFVIVYPIIGAGGRFMGVIGCAVDISSIAALHIIPVQPSASSYAWLLDDTGTILFHPDPRLTGRNIDAVIDEMEGVSGLMEIRRGMELKNGGTYQFVFPHYPDDEPVHKLLAFSSAHFLNKRWITVVTAPYSEVIALMAGTFRNTLVLGSGSVALVILVTIVVLGINKDRVRAYERNKWADKMLVAHRRLQTVFNALPHYLIMIDSAFTITDINQRYCELFGLQRSDFIDKHCLVDLDKAVRPCRAELVEQVFRSGELMSEREVHLEINGRPYLFDISAIPLHDSNGAVEYVIQYAVDVTETKALVEKLIQADKLAAVGQMSAHVAHEIRNPLASVLLHTELLEDEIREQNLSAEASDLIRIIQQEIDRLAIITDEYMSYARLPHPKVQAVDPLEEIESAVATMLPEVSKRAIEVEVKAQDLPENILIDRGQFRQVLINFIKNAVEAMPSGGKLELSALGRGEEFLLMVKDTGYGIPHDIARRIFDPYFTTKENGTGLGLSLVQYIANAHDGWVNVESEMNRGTTFTFAVPMAPKD